MNNHQKYRGRILAISNGIFPTQQSTKSTFWMEHFINNHNQQNQHFGQKISKSVYYPSNIHYNLPACRAWVRAECGERERESRVSSLVDPSENGGGRRRMEPREKFER